MKKMTILFIAIMLFPLVGAFGAGCSYWDERPLIMAPGETKQISCKLQNTVGDEDITMKVELLEGREIVTLTDESLEYFVPLGTKDAEVNMEVNIPKKSEDETRFNVRLSFQQVSNGEGGNVKLSGIIQKSFEVIVETDLEKAPEESAKKEGKSMFIILILILVIVASLGFLLFIIIRLRKKDDLVIENNNYV
jgi:hypothetical protein